MCKEQKVRSQMQRQVIASSFRVVSACSHEGNAISCASQNAETTFAYRASEIQRPFKELAVRTMPYYSTNGAGLTVAMSGFQKLCSVP